MSDIFISYAREDRPLAEAVAKDLKARGYRVWWDADLVGADDFYEVILEALTRAKAAIVIWTKTSAKSRFVRDEARFALHTKKLVALRDPRLDPMHIPFGFQSQHTDYVNDPVQILKALHKLGVRPVAAAPQPAALNLDRLRAASLIDVVNFLGTNPPEAQRVLAIRRLKEIAAASKASGGASELVRRLRMSNWQAFLSGLVFRVPSFQFSTQGTWTSLGLALGYLVLAALGFFVITSIPTYLRDQLRWSGPQTALAVGTLLCALAWFIWNRLEKFVRQRNILASLVVGVAFIVPATLGTCGLAVGFLSDVLNPARGGGQLGGILIALSAFFLALVSWKIASAR